MVKKRHRGAEKNNCVKIIESSWRLSAPDDLIKKLFLCVSVANYFASCMIPVLFLTSSPPGTNLIRLFMGGSQNLNDPTDILFAKRRSRGKTENVTENFFRHGKR